MQPTTQPWFSSVEDIFKNLETTHDGISNTEAQTRLVKFGTNTFHKKEKKSVVFIFLKQFVSPLIFLLIGAVVLTGILHEWLNMAVIGFAVLLNVALGFYHEYHAENTLEKLTTYIKDRTRVIHDGKEYEIDSTLLVPGDIVKLSYGTRVPADTRVISTNNFRVDESVLTGESIPIEKHNESVPISALVADRKNIAHAGT